VAGEAKGVCPCEQHAHGELGTVQDGEELARLVVSPAHFRKDGTLKPGMFPVSHLSSGLSLLRIDHLAPNELLAQAKAIVASNEENAPAGIRMVSAAALRAELSQDGLRCLCVIDDPVIGDEKLPDNPAHAITVKSSAQDEPEILRIRQRLMEIFGPLISLVDAVKAKE